MALQSLQALAVQKLEPPLAGQVLKETRAALIQKPDSAVGQGCENPDLSPLFASILQTASIPTLTQPHRALACDAISTWLIRSSSSTALRDAVAAHPTAWDSLVAVIFGNFDDAQSGLSKALKDLFGNVLSTYPTVDGTRDRFMQGLAERVLDGVRSGAGRKVGYYVLEVLVRKKIIGAAWTMGRYRDLCAPCAAEDGDKLVRDMMACLKDRTLSPVIGKALVGLLSARRQEIVAAAGTQAEWMELWEAPLKSVLAVEELRGNVQIYALPGLFKISPECFGVFVEGLGLARYSDETAGDGGEDESADDGKELMSLLCSLKVGKDLGLVGEINATFDPKNNLKPTLRIPSSFVTPLLSHAHPHIRLAALTLLTYTPTPSRALPSSAFPTLKAALPPLHAEPDAEIRNLVIGSIRALTERLSHNHDAPFTSWYLQFLQTQLAPGTSYQRATTALRVLAGSKTLVDVFEPAMRRVLTDALLNPFDDVRAMAAEALGRAGGARWDIVLGRAMNGSGRARDADGAARIVGLWFEQGGAEGGCVCGLQVPRGKGLEVVRWVLAVLARYLEVARSDFQKAVREHPVHGLLGGLRLVLEKPGVYQTGTPAEWRGVHEAVFTACGEIWEITRGVLCEASPEGHMPELAGEEEDEDVNTQTVMSYSWRAVKESGTLLGTILSTAPYTADADSTLTQRDFETGGELLLAQLANIRHRGAFSAVSPSFIALCTRCFKASDPALQALPKTWLTENLGLIMSKSNAITRRSAGLPFLIIGILISETDPARPLLKSSFARLTEIAALPLSQGAKTDLPQVHALNCIKFLFTDSRLAAAAADYIGPGLELAVACFASATWAVRNCGIMLFTTLLNRLFGARRSRNEYGSALDTRAFFERYPSVKAVLLRNLAATVDALDTARVEMVYPALSLLARLDYAEGYAEFEPLVAACMRCCVWKVREMAARAYSTLVGPQEVGAVVGTLLVGATAANQNHAHGALCAVAVLLERGGAEVMPCVWKALGAVFDGLVVRNRCAVTKALYLRILTDHAVSAGLVEQEREPWLDMLNGISPLNSGEKQPSDGHKEDISSLKESVSVYCNRSDEALAEINNTSVVGRSLLKEQLTRFMLAKAIRQPAAYNRIHELILLLGGPDEEAALAIATLLLDTTNLPLTLAESSLLDHTLWNLIASHDWDQLRVAALKLTRRYGAAGTALEQRWRTVLDLAQTPPSEPCRDAALAALGTVTAEVWSAWQLVDGGDIWAVWCVDELVKQIHLTAHEDMPYPTREAALAAMKALAPVLAFSRLPGWRSPPDRLRGAYFALYDMLNDDDEDIRDEAAAAACRVLGGKVRLSPLKTGDVLAARMGREFCASSGFFEDVVGRLAGGVRDVGTALEEALRADTILFAREKQNLFVDRALEAERWASVLRDCNSDEGAEERCEFVFWVISGLAALAAKADTLGHEGALGWISDEEVFVLGVKVLEGLRAVAGWNARGDVEDALWARVEGAGRELEERLGGLEGHELWVRRLRENISGHEVSLGGSL